MSPILGASSEAANDAQFYSTCAQVIPVLLLALFVERRWLHGGGAKHEAVEELATLVLLLMGEFTAILALVQTPGDISKAAVILAVSWGFLALMARPLGRLINAVAANLGMLLFGLVLAIWGGLGYAGVKEAAAIVGIGVFLALMVIAMPMRTRADVAALRAQTGGNRADDAETSHRRATRLIGLALAAKTIVVVLRRRR